MKNGQFVIDATVVRPPYSGVQRSVLLEAEAEIRALGGARIFRREDLPAWLPGVSGRIAWQQTLLPRLLRKTGAAALQAMAYTAPWFCPVPYVLNVHDVIALEHPELCSWQNALHIRTLMPHSIRHAGGIIVSSSSVADRVQVLFPESKGKVHVVPLGVDAPHFAKEAQRPHLAGLPENMPYFLYLGNIEPKKGLWTLLEAYSAIAEKAGLALVVAGRLCWKSSLLYETMREWHGPGCVIMPGRVAEEELAGLYQHAECFVFPSLAEGFGMPVLEAMAAGCPVVHSDIPVLAETAGGAGLAFHAGDPVSLARALLKLHESAALRKELAEKGQKRVEKTTWQAWGESAAGILQSLI